MNSKQDKQTSRRRMALDAVRWGLAAGMGALSVHFLRGKSGLQESDCIDAKGLTGCRACIEWNYCRLPRALSVKQFLHKKNDQPNS
jgi:hypothetical protein